MRVVDFLLGVAAPLIVIFLTPTVLAARSKLQTGNWLAWTERLSLSTVGWFVGTIALWFMAVGVRRRLRCMSEGSVGISSARAPLGGWVEVGAVSYAGVKWRLRAPRGVPYSVRPASVEAAELEADLPPRCPRCETEVEENPRFWGGYSWSCIRCGFRKHNRDSYYLEASRAERLARRGWEEAARGSPP